MDGPLPLPPIPIPIPVDAHFRTNTVVVDFATKWCECSHDVRATYINHSYAGENRWKDRNEASERYFIHCLGPLAEKLVKDPNVEKTTITVRWLTRQTFDALNTFFDTISGSSTPKHVELWMSMHERVEVMDDAFVMAAFLHRMVSFFHKHMSHPKARIVVSVLPSSISWWVFRRGPDSKQLVISRDRSKLHKIEAWATLLKALGRLTNTIVDLVVGPELPAETLTHDIQNLEIFVDSTGRPLTESEAISWADKVDCRLFVGDFGDVPPSNAFQQWVVRRRFFEKPRWLVHIEWREAGKTQFFAGVNDSFDGLLAFVVGGGHPSSKTSAAGKFLKADGDHAVTDRVFRYLIKV